MLDGKSGFRKINRRLRTFAGNVTAFDNRNYCFAVLFVGDADKLVDYAEILFVAVGNRVFGN